jgi:hypothetical protein
VLQIHPQMQTCGQISKIFFFPFRRVSINGRATRDPCYKTFVAVTLADEASLLSWPVGAQLVEPATRDPMFEGSNPASTCPGRKRVFDTAKSFDLSLDREVLL